MRLQWGIRMDIQKSNKINYINIAKALGIILVVIGHSISPINKLIYLFHMPLFFFISGYLYNDSYSLKPINLIEKRLKTLYLPYVKYGLIFLALHNVLFKVHIYDETINKIKPYSVKDILIHIHNTLAFHGSELMLGAFWFLPALFIVNVLFCLYNYAIRRLGVKSERKIQYILAVMVALSFTLGLIKTKLSLPQFLNTNVAFVAISIYYAGYLFKKYEHKIKFNIVYASISFMVLIILWLRFDVTVQMNKNNYSNPALFIVGWILGIYFIIYISKLLSKRKNVLLNYIGSNTITIMALHFISLKLVTIIQIYLYNLPISKLASYPVLDSKNGWWVVYAIVGIFIPLLVKYLCEQIYKLFRNAKKVKFNN